MRTLVCFDFFAKKVLVTNFIARMNGLI